MPRRVPVAAAVLLALVLLPAVGGEAKGAATCSQYSTQAAAQAAADTRDGDGDGLYCESLPCPCAGPGAHHDPPPAPTPSTTGCVRPHDRVDIAFDAKRYPNIRSHFRGALRRGWPLTLVLNRRGAGARRDRLLRDVPTHARFDRDEYPPALARGRGKGLVGGGHPVGWKADVRYVPSSENRSHGSVLGHELRAFCDGTKFRYVFH